MSTARHFDRIACAALAVAILLTALFACSAELGLPITAAHAAPGYVSRIFDTSRVHTLDIVMDDWDGFLETCENEEYSPCAVVIDGEAQRNVAIRAKGNTSLRQVAASGSDRYSFKIEFDHYDSANTYHGLDKLSLNNLIQDDSMMKDYLVYRLMAQFGVAAPLCSYVWVTVNGEDWGLYLAVEAVEDAFLARNYGSDSGELYKPDSADIGGGRGNGRDFDFDEFRQRMEEEGIEMPEGEMPALPEGEPPAMPDAEMPQGEPPAMPDGGEMPQMPDGEAPGQPEEGTFEHGPGGRGEAGGFGRPGGMQEGDGASDFQNRPDGAQDTDGAPDFQGRPGGMQGGRGGGPNMAADDVLLKYSSDDPADYPNIFDNAKTDVSAADEQRLLAALKTLNGQTDADPAAAVETDAVLRYFVVHGFVCNGDSYTGSIVHNYYLRECDGRLSMLPWDYNLAFGGFGGGSTASESIAAPVTGGTVEERPMLAWIFADEAYTAEYYALYQQVVDECVTGGKLEALIEETAALIAPYVGKDPTKFCATEDFAAGVETLQSFCTARLASVQEQLEQYT